MEKNKRMSFVRRVPSLAAQIERNDPIAVEKLRAHWKGKNYYICGFDGHDTCFGLIEDRFPSSGKLKFFSLSEVLGLRGPKDEIVERDENFAPTRISDIREGWERLKK